MTLIQLRYLVAIVDAGLNISVAARRVNATQPGLSKQLKQIEEELGFPVFFRHGKSLDGLSPAGAPVVERARVILAEVANIGALAADHRSDTRGELRIVTTHTQANFVLPPPLTELKARFPQVRISLVHSGEREALDQMEQDSADIALVSSQERPVTDDLAIPIYRWDMVGVARQDQAFDASDLPLTLAGLAALPLVTYESALHPASSFARTFASAGFRPRVAATARDADLIKAYVRSGLGLGVLAEMAVGEDEPGLRVFGLDRLFPTRTTWAVLRRERILLNHVLEFLRAIAPHLDRRDLRRAFDTRPADTAWPEPPHWRDLHPEAVMPARSPPIRRPELKLVAGLGSTHTGASQ
jgi:LysR family cys regulon transcriptional activator